MQIHFIRHTRTSIAPNICYGQSNVKLADTFLKDALPIARSLRESMFDAVYTSPLSRCKELAAICGYEHAIVDSRLQELNFGKWELQSRDSIANEVAEWEKDFVHRRAGGNGESFEMMYARFISFIEEIKGKGYHKVCVFTHSGILRCALLYLNKCSMDEVFGTPISFGAHIEVRC